MKGWVFAIGDYSVGALTGIAAAGAIGSMVDPGHSMFYAMAAGMAAGMAVHLLIGFAASPLLGVFHTMTPGSLIGMYGGMVIGMLAASGHAYFAGSLTTAGAVTGLALVASIRLLDARMRGPAALTIHRD